MARPKFAEGEFYHIYNRGVEKRDIFSDKYDLERFLKGLSVFNREEPIGSIYEYFLRSERENLGVQLPRELDSQKRLVEMVCYCVNPNHYHLLLKQVSENGISKFMHKLGTSYTNYFNEKNKRSGALFQGRFKAVHVNNNEYLLHLSAYINLNFKVHNEWQGDEAKKKLTKSSWDEYIGGSDSQICEKNLILGQFSSAKDYKNFAEDSLESIKMRKSETSDIFKYFLD